MVKPQQASNASSNMSTLWKNIWEGPTPVPAPEETPEERAANASDDYTSDEEADQEIAEVTALANSLSSPSTPDAPKYEPLESDRDSDSDSDTTSDVSDATEIVHDGDESASDASVTFEGNSAGDADDTYSDWEYDDFTLEMFRNNPHFAQEWQHLNAIGTYLSLRRMVGNLSPRDEIWHRGDVEAFNVGKALVFRHIMSLPVTSDVAKREMMNYLL